MARDSIANGAEAGILDSLDPDTDSQSALREWLSFQNAFHLRPQRAIEWLAQEGALGAWRVRPGVGSRPASNIEAQFAVLRRCRVRALPWLAQGYPRRLHRLSDAAPLLLLRGEGDAALLERPCVAIVGSRAASAYGLEVASELGKALARAGVVVVSGLARGVDAAAHEGALLAGGPTVAVQACGPEIVYPAQHRGLARRIRATGLVLTEMPPGTPPRAPYFPLRNRLISGLSRVVVVVEARRRSGSLITARHALDQGVDVMAVPGAVGVATSEGPNRLLAEGARPCLGAADVLEELGIEAPEPPASPSAPAVPLSGEGRRIVASLAACPESRDALALRLGLSAQSLAVHLLALELEGHVATDRDGRLRVVSGRG
jgi:DNA processing protein